MSYLQWHKVSYYFCSEELRYNSYLILVISLIISNLNGLTFLEWIFLLYTLKQPDFLSYFMMLPLAWSIGAGTALVVHAKNSRPRWASNPHQTTWIHIKIFMSACPFPKEEIFEDFLLAIHMTRASLRLINCYMIFFLKNESMKKI